MDQTEASPAVQPQLTFAGSVSRSFAEGSVLPERRAERCVSAKQVERVSRRIGAERDAERDAAGAAFQAVPLVEKFQTPAGVETPDLAVVMADGGRLQILDRGPPAAADTPTAAAGEAAITPEVSAAEAWEEDKTPAGPWREDKGRCC
jgi:hypothetical protein